jgi:hypothetical protein
MKYIILPYDNANMREIFASRGDLIEETDCWREPVGTGSLERRNMTSNAYSSSTSA